MLVGCAIVRSGWRVFDELKVFWVAFSFITFAGVHVHMLLYAYVGR